MGGVQMVIELLGGRGRKKKDARGRRQRQASIGNITLLV